jgi:hypothetical protein
MPITINTYCRVNRNGSININTDPTFPIIIPIPQFLCVSGATPAEVNGTYEFAYSLTANGYTRPIYKIFQFSSYDISNDFGGKYRIVQGFGDPPENIYEGTTFPPPANPSLETLWYFANTVNPAPITITAGPC